MSPSSTRLALPLLAVLLLAGCLGGGKPPKHLIALTPEAMAPAGAMVGGVMADAIAVLDPEIDRRLDVQRVAVQVNDSTVAYLVDAGWVERPNRQFRRLLAETIRARGKRLVIEGGGDSSAARTTLSGRLTDMGYDARRGAVVVLFDAQRTEKTGQIQTRRFGASVPVAAGTAKYVVPALNKAANDVARQVADWVD